MGSRRDHDLGLLLGRELEECPGGRVHPVDQCLVDAVADDGEEPRARTGGTDRRCDERFPGRVVASDKSMTGT